MRSLLLVVTAVAVSSHAEVGTLVGTYQGHEVGKAVYTVEKHPDGSVVKSFDIDITVGTQSFVSKAIVHVDAAGRSLDKKVFSSVNGVTRTDQSFAYGKNSVVVSNKLTGGKKTFTFPSKPPAMDPSDLWFVRIKPVKGAKNVASVLPTDKGWQTITTVYLGDRAFHLGGKIVAGHRVQRTDASGTAERLLDDHGIPLHFDLAAIPGLSFTRK